MREVTLNCPVCGHRVPIFEDERRPSGTCQVCKTRVELPVSAFAVLALREGPPPAPASPLPQQSAPAPRPARAAGPARPAAAQPAPQQQEPQDQPSAEPTPAEPQAHSGLPMPHGPIVIASDDETDREQMLRVEPLEGSKLDLFESTSPRGIVGAYFHRRRRSALPIPRWLLIWLTVLVGVVFVALLLYVVIWTAG